MAKSRQISSDGRKIPTTGSLSKLFFFGVAVLSSSRVLAAPSQPNPSPILLPPPQPVITAPPILQPRQDPQLQALSQQLQDLSAASRQVSQSSQQLSITSAQLVNSVQQLSNRLIQTEQSVIALRGSVNNVEQASRSLSQQVAEVSRSAERQMSERLQRASQTMVENMSSMSQQMESSFARRLAQASRNAVALSQGRVEQPDNNNNDNNVGLETGFGAVPTGSPQQQQQEVQGMRTEVVIGAVVGGVVGSMLLSVIGVFVGLKIRQRQQQQGRLGPGIGGGIFGGMGGNKGGSPNIGNPVLQSTSNKAYASVGLGPGGVNKDREKDMGVGKRMSDASSAYSSDFGDDEKGLLKQQQQQPSPATLAREAPDLRRLVLERSNTAISRKSVGGGQQKVGFATSYYGSSSQPLPPTTTTTKAVGTGAIKGLNANASNDNNVNDATKVMTPTAMTIVKMGGDSWKTKEMMKGFQLSQPPPGKLSLFPRSDGGSSGGNSPVDESDDGKGTPKRLESWLRKERGIVSPFLTAPEKK